jgi:hypothetical protein
MDLFESISPSISKDFLIGFLLALSLRRRRIEQLLDRMLPTTSDEPSDGSDAN